MIFLALALLGAAVTIVGALAADQPLTRHEREYLAACLVFITGCILLTLAALAWLP